jgi:hypothetical protein
VVIRRTKGTGLMTVSNFKRIVKKVLELHSPVFFYRVNGDKKILCNLCKISYPCATVQLIEEEGGNV